MTDLVTRYISLGLALGRHLDGLVDAYYGPPELQTASEQGAPRPLPALADDARHLIADLDGGREPDLSARRRAWVRAQTVGLHTMARKLGGEVIAYEDEVEQCYGVRPREVPEDELAAAHRRLDEALPGSGPLRERFIEWREAQTIPGEKLEAVIQSLAEDFRERTDRRLRSARRRDDRVAARDGQAVVGVQLLPGRAAQPGRDQRRPAGARHRHRAPRRPRGLSRAPHRAHPQGGRPGPSAGPPRGDHLPGRHPAVPARRGPRRPRPRGAARRAARADRGRAPACRSACATTPTWPPRARPPPRRCPRCAGTSR